MEDTTTAQTNNNRRKGFGSMSSERRREIASLGGRTAQERGHGHRWTPEQAAHAGRIGGSRSKRRPRTDIAVICRRLRETNGRIALVARELNAPYHTVRNWWRRIKAS